MPLLYAALYEAVAAASRLGLDVVVDVGHHDGERRRAGHPRRLRPAARRAAGAPRRGPLPARRRSWQRRRAGQAGREGLYAAAAEGEPVPAPVLAWQRAVHEPGIYDLELDTSACLAPAAGRRGGDPRGG